MLELSLGLVLIAGVFGSVLAAMHLRAGGKRPGLVLGVLHGALGIFGWVALLFALGGPPRGAAMGVSSFGQITAVLLAAALLVGLAILVARLRRRGSLSLLIGAHATVAIGGIVILAAYVLVG